MSQEINLLNPALLPRRDALGFEAVTIATAVMAAGHSATVVGVKPDR